MSYANSARRQKEKSNGSAEKMPLERSEIFGEPNEEIKYPLPPQYINDALKTAMPRKLFPQNGLGNSSNVEKNDSPWGSLEKPGNEYQSVAHAKPIKIFITASELKQIKVL